MSKVFNVGLIGCGHISETYFRGHDYFNNFKIVKCADINFDNSEKCAETYGISACSVEEHEKSLKDIYVSLRGQGVTHAGRRCLIEFGAGLEMHLSNCCFDDIEVHYSLEDEY